jgi:23S rRNA pseudouridine1911/1915/1917 synthase
LHAWVLGLTHPGSGERLEFSAPLPDDLTGLIEALRADQQLHQGEGQ